jgi:hypothetical protein
MDDHCRYCGKLFGKKWKQRVTLKIFKSSNDEQLAEMVLCGIKHVIGGERGWHVLRRVFTRA